MVVKIGTRFKTLWGSGYYEVVRFWTDEKIVEAYQIYRVLETDVFIVDDRKIEAFFVSDITNPKFSEILT